MKMKDFMKAISNVDGETEVVLAFLDDDCSIGEEKIAGVCVNNNKVFIVKNDYDFKRIESKKQKDIIIKKLAKAVKMSYKNEFYNILYFSIENEQIELEYGDCDTCWISFDDVISNGWKFYGLNEI